MSRGTSEEFDSLHGRTVRILNRMLEAAERGMLVDEAGNVTMPPPALLAQAIKFLQVNGIDRPATGTHKVDTLKDRMPDLDSIGNVVPIKR